MRITRGRLVWLTIIVLACLAVFMMPAKGRRGPVTLSKETTYITEPLREDGYVDYLAALNQRFSAGVTPENNAAVPFLRAVGPGEIRPEHREEYYRMLGIPPPPASGEYYITLEKYAACLKPSEKPTARAGVHKEAVLYDQEIQAMKRPWMAKEFPAIAGWLAANEKPLALLVEASKRPRRYDPLIAKDDMAICALLPMISKYRETSQALRARAMLRVAEDKPDQAWTDLLANHRLARLVAQGATLIDNLVAITVEGSTCPADCELLQHARVTAAHTLKMRDDLATLPPMAKMADKMEFAERLMFLDCVRIAANQGWSGFRRLSSLSGAGPTAPHQSVVDSLSRAVINWDYVFRMGNNWYDRIVEAMRKPTYAERWAELSLIERDLHELAVESRDWKRWLSPRAGPSQQVGATLVSMLSVTHGVCAKAEDRGAMQLEVTKLAFALAAYRAEHGTYPAKLTELVPKYVKTVPEDIFISAPLHYRREGGGYLLYSLGPNGKDDGGRGMEDRKEGEDCDDIGVRMTEPGK
jgi:hypothetical protein